MIVAVFIFLATAACFTGFAAQQHEAKYFNIPMHEILQHELYITVSDFGEITVTYSGRGADLRPGDYITHADGVRVLSGGLADFLKSNEKEVMVPVVDDEDMKFDGSKLLGFVMLQSATPRKLSSRRGEILFDLEEGGPPPSMKLGNIVIGSGAVKTTSDPTYKPPPHGGGPCITGRDCYHHNGTCTMGACVCKGVFTGTYCQLHRPDFTSVKAGSGQPTAGIFVPPKPSTRQSDRAKADVQPPYRGETADVALEASVHRARPADSKQSPPTEPANSFAAIPETGRAGDMPSPPVAGGDEDGGPKKKRKRKPKPAPVADGEQQASTAWTRGEDTGRAAKAGLGMIDENQQRAATVDDLYGPGKAYPEPYPAGKLPNAVVHERYKKRFNREAFTYSVRFRQGPFGLSFDNRIPDATIVEKLTRGEQAELSDIKVGDQLIAIDQYNTTGAPAKATQRIMGTLPWPRTLVFLARPTGEDPRKAEGTLRSRTFNVSIIYPPSLVTEFQVRLADWTPGVDVSTPIHSLLKQQMASGKPIEQFCPVFRVKAPEDPFGCKQSSIGTHSAVVGAGGIGEGDFVLPSALETMMQRGGLVDPEVEAVSPMFSMLLQEAATRKITLEPRSLAIVKRGVCTFVEKARGMHGAGAHLGLVVNTDNELLDIPAGKEKTAGCGTPVAIAKDSDATLTHLAARTNDVWAVISEQGAELSPACARVSSLAEDIVDRWPHSVPPMKVATVLQSAPPDTGKLRGVTEEGGRIAISGENGWAFFDYHLAMFGPPEVPLGPFRLQMALPPFGCDPSAYTVRIKDTVVAILRGGGCSFGIKVINAQKLGAKAVIIVNTDDMKTMRLMALPDEVPLITIPCIMVSRRIQFYLEEQLRPYYPLDQHLVSLQPTGLFGEYEKRNSVALPVRLSNQ